MSSAPMTNQNKSTQRMVSGNTTQLMVAILINQSGTLAPAEVVYKSLELGMFADLLSLYSQLRALLL